MPRDPTAQWFLLSCSFVQAKQTQFANDFMSLLWTVDGAQEGIFYMGRAITSSQNPYGLRHLWLLKISLTEKPQAAFIKGCCPWGRRVQEIDPKLQQKWPSKAVGMRLKAASYSPTSGFMWLLI